MRNRMYGGVRGRKTKVGRKLLRFPPTRFIFVHLRAVGRCCFWHGTPLKMRPLRQEAVHSLWSRLFCGPLKMRSMWQVLFCAPLKMRRVPEKAIFDNEYIFRTVEACFLHRMLPKTRRVPQCLSLKKVDSQQRVNNGVFTHPETVQLL